MVQIAVTASVAVLAGCGGAAGWSMGIFASKGRFRAVDACTLMPPPTVLAPLVRNGARERGDSRPRTLLGHTSGGDLASQCKWSSVPTGQDRPFRTVRVHVETKKRRQGPVSAEDSAEKALALWRKNTSPSRARTLTKVDLGEEGYTRTDQMAIQITVFRTDVYDLHAKFRASNAVVDVSARTHTEPGEKERALVLDLAREVAARLDRTR
ncbi:hypothetical protein GCM10023085_14620 [Actinomadura viridis]